MLISQGSASVLVLLLALLHNSLALEQLLDESRLALLFEARTALRSAPLRLKAIVRARPTHELRVRSGHVRRPLAVRHLRGGGVLVAILLQRGISMRRFQRHPQAIIGYYFDAHVITFTTRNKLISWRGVRSIGRRLT